VTEPVSSELAARLQEAGPDELWALVEHLGERLDVPLARRILANPHCSVEIVTGILARKDLLSAYELRKALVFDPRTPQVPALSLVPTLYWIDLVSAGLDMHVRPVVRRGADRRLIELLPSLAVGERMAIARRSSLGVQRAISRDRQPRVVRALLDNPRVTDGVVIPMAASAATPPAILDVIATDRRWSVRYGVRVAICRNPSTPVPTTLRLLPLLKKHDLRAVKQEHRVSPEVRRRAELLLGDPS